MTKTMLQKTIELALEIGEKCRATSEEKHTIETLIRHAFDSYAEAWKGIHTKAETKREWEYFYNDLKRITDLSTAKQVKEDLTKYSGSINNAWTRDFLAIMEIFLKAPTK